MSDRLTLQLVAQCSVQEQNCSSVRNCEVTNINLTLTAIVLGLVWSLIHCNSYILLNIPK